jgi:NADH pyrophosphatase NudC (nudix superfamily)
MMADPIVFTGERLDRAADRRPATAWVAAQAAGSRSGEPRGVDDELEDVRWFDRDDLAGAIAGRDDSPLGVPPRFAIARRLMERWVRR